mgnify:CR=1 FL=1
MNKRLWIWFLVFMLLSGGCQVREDAAGYGADIKKAQEIAVIPFGETQETKVLTEEAEIEAFAQGLGLGTWAWKPLPDQAEALGSFRFSQAGTQQLWQAAPGKLRPVGDLTLYRGGYVRLSLHHLALDFAIGADAAAYLAGYLA